MATSFFQNLRRFIQPPPPSEKCKICGAGLEDDHPHLIEPARRKPICACNACAMLFAAEGACYKRIPRRAHSLNDYRISHAQWDRLMIPVSVAFFFKSGGNVVALYPSPAGPIELPVSLHTWDAIAGRHPVLRAMEPDVEALMVNHWSGEYFLLPIDKCFDLLGLIRSHCQGQPGGSNAWEKLRRYFAGLEEPALG
jgi:hypothetical protein